MTLLYRVFLLLIFGFFGQFTCAQVLREGHEFLWQGQEDLRKLHWIDALDVIPERIPAADTAYFQSLIYLTQGYRLPARKAIKQHVLIAGHQYPYASKIILGLAHSNMCHQAYGYYLAAISLNPNRVEAYVEKLKVLSDQKDYLIGIDHANEAIRLFPKKLELYVFRGNLYVVEGLRKRAVRDFKRVIDREGQLSDYFLAQAHRGLAWAYLGENELTKAELHLSESRTLTPNHPFSMGLQAEIKFLKGDAKGTIETYEQISDTQLKENYYLMIGLAYEELGQKKEACEFYTSSCLRNVPLGCKKMKELGCQE